MPIQNGNDLPMTKRDLAHHINVGKVICSFNFINFNYWVEFIKIVEIEFDYTLMSKIIGRIL